MKIRTIALLITFWCSGCSMLSRSSESGFGETNRQPHVKRTSISRLQEDVSLPTKTRLKQLENSINTRKELDQYSKALPWFKNDLERIEFLNLPGFEARQKWLTENSFSNRSTTVQNQMAALVETQDIAVGMPQNLVKRAWGDPESVEVSGNPQFKNERWKYSKYIPTGDGFKPEKKSVYFEGGKVVAWEIE
jgi:hypothetical protein